MSPRSAPDLSRHWHDECQEAPDLPGGIVVTELPDTRLPPMSILDLAPIVEGGSVSAALSNSLDLAQHVERWGYERFWLAEHHNSTGIASAATAVVIAHVAGGTRTIRVGAGGIMLPNHAPLVIAEQFGTLAALHPGRIDLGLGRAPGTDQLTMLALRRDHTSADTFPQDVLELQALLGDPQPGQAVQAIPGAGTHVPLWILGSSLYRRTTRGDAGPPVRVRITFRTGRAAAGARGLPRAVPALRAAPEPYTMVAANVIVADDDAHGPPPLHLGAASVHERLPRSTRAAPAPDRRHRVVLDTRREDARVPDAEPLVRRLTPHSSERSRHASSKKPAQTN